MAEALGQKLDIYTTLVVLFFVIGVCGQNGNSCNNNGQGQGNSGNNCGGNNGNNGNNGNTGATTESPVPDDYSFTVCTLNKNLLSNSQYENFLSLTFTGSSPSYNKLAIPIERATDYPLDVNVSFSLLQINDFDEVSGTLELVGFLHVVWMDARVDDSFDEVEHGLLTKFLIPEDSVWLPPLSVFNSVKAIKPIADSTYHVRVEMGFQTCVLNASVNGSVSINSYQVREKPTLTWKPGINSKTTCAINVQDFPFDTQECTVRFISFGHPSSEVRYNPLTDFVDTTNYQESSEWILDGSSIEVKEMDGSSIIYITFKFTRRPLYYVVNLILPIMILAVISCLVFFLPGNSGERVGYSVTAFLTFAVYLTMVSDNLPKTSDPMSTLCYFLMCMVAISAATALLTIFTLRIFHKDEKKPVPDWLANVVGCLNCRVCGQDEFEDPEFPLMDMNKKRRLDTRSIVTTDSEEEMERKWDVDWKLVASTMDMLFFIVFLGLNVLVCIIFLAPLLSKFNMNNVTW